MCVYRLLGFLDVYFPTRAFLTSFLNLKVPALGQARPTAPELRPTQEDHRAVPRSSAQQNRESLCVRVVGILNSASSFKMDFRKFFSTTNPQRTSTDMTSTASESTIVGNTPTSSSTAASNPKRTL